MANLSTRQAYLAKQAGLQPAPLIEYEVIDPYHKPDLNGELAGGKVYKRAGKQYVELTAQQARFYLDSGSIKPVADEQPKP
jgi:hypothetical protein